MSSFNKNIDLFTVVRILKNFMTEYEAKVQYGILSGKVDTLCVLPLSLNIPFVTGMVPTISKSMAQYNINQATDKIKFFLQITIIIALPCTVGLIIFAEPILNLLFPNASSGAELLKINSISILFTMLAQTINGALQGIGKNKVPMIAFSIGMIFKFLANILLVSIKSIGIKGAVIGNIICNLTVCIIGFVVLTKNINLKIDIKNFILKPFFITFLMSITGILINFLLKNLISERLTTIASIVDAASVYISLTFTLKAVKRY